MHAEEEDTAPNNLVDYLTDTSKSQKLEAVQVPVSDRSQKTASKAINMSKPKIQSPAKEQAKPKAQSKPRPRHNVFEPPRTAYDSDLQTDDTITVFESKESTSDIESVKENENE